MSTDGLNLPNDVEQLKAMVADPEQFLVQIQTVLAARDELLVQRNAVIASQHETIEKQLKKLAGMERQLARLLRRQFGPQQERIDPNQLTLFTENELLELAKELEQGATDTVSTDDGSQEEAASTGPSSADASTTKPKGEGHGRRPIPLHIPREIVSHELSELERVCECCGRRKKEISREVSVQIESMASAVSLYRRRRPRDR